MIRVVLEGMRGMMQFYDSGPLTIYGATGATIGVTVSHIALRVFKQNPYSLNKPILLTHAVFGISGYFLNTRYQTNIANFVVAFMYNKEEPNDKFLTNAFFINGVITTTVVYLVVFKIWFNSFFPLGIIGVPFQLLGIMIAGVHYSTQAELWPYRIHGYSDEIIRKIVGNAALPEVANFNSWKGVDVRQPVVFADEFGKRNDTTPEDVRSLFDVVVFKHDYPQLKLHPPPCGTDYTSLSGILSEKTLDKFLDPSSYYPTDKFLDRFRPPRAEKDQVPHVRRCLLELTSHDPALQAKIHKAFAENDK